MILALYEPRPSEETPVPVMSDSVPAGFPSPAAYSMEGTIDLNAHLVRHPAATFIVRVEGDSMKGAGIFSGDLAVVDRSLSPRHSDIVIAVIAGELTIKRLVRKRGQTILSPENPAYPPIVLRDENDLLVWGVVSSVIRQLRTS